MATTTRPFGSIRSGGEETWRTVVELTPKQLTRLKRLMKAHLAEVKAADSAPKRKTSRKRAA